MLPYDGLGAMHDARTQSRSVVDVDEAVVADLFKRSGAVVADVSAASYVTTCRNLAYKARTVIEEMGANALHLTLGELVWELDGRELRAPLVLLPVHIRAMAGERRYEVVIDNYRSGKYPKRERFGDEFFKTQGGLMEAFASVGELSEEIAAGLRIERDETLQTIVRSRQELRGRFGETKQELAERYETILQKVDRYL